jgi:hypothetical protein
MTEILNPAARTYWLAGDGVGHIHGVTLPHQQTTLGAGWSMLYAGTDEQSFLAVCEAAGVTPQLPTTTVSARQVRLWLVGAGIILSAVDAAIESIADPAQREMVRVEWEYAPYIERTHPMLVPLGATLGLTEEQIDVAFAEAALL